jgi:hypothetical protein
MSEHTVIGTPHSMDHDSIRHELVMIWYDDNHAGKRAMEMRVPITDVVRFLQDVNSTGLHVIDDAARDLAYGDCRTCNNVRLVRTVGPGGRESNEHCPDCRAGGNLAPFSNVPMIRRSEEAE